MQHVFLWRSKQTTRDIACAGVFIGAALWYVHNLFAYLAAMQRPALLILGFTGSFAIAVFHDLHKHSLRLSLMLATRTAIVFAIGVIVAHRWRDLYMTLLGDIAGVPEIQALLGPDLFSALTNRVVGYGGSFAVGLLLVRWVLGRPIERLIERTFLAPALSLKTCPHCQQLIR